MSAAKLLAFENLLWSIFWFHEIIFEQISNAINWLPAFRNNVFTLEQLNGIFPSFLIHSAKQSIHFCFSFFEPLLIPDYNNRPTWKLIEVMAQPSPWPAVQKNSVTMLLENVCSLSVHLKVICMDYFTGISEKSNGICSCPSE